MRRETLIALLIVIVIIIGSIGYLSYTGYLKLGLPGTTPSETSEKKVVVYTYESLLAWGKEGEKLRQRLFQEFENETGIKVEVVYFSDAGEMLAKIIEEVKSGRVRADVVIGLDNIQILKAKENGVLIQYTPPNINEIYDWLIQSYDPDYYAIPYDYSLIAFVYDTKYINNTIMENLTFDDFINSPKLAKTLVVEDPRISSTGLSFLLYEIAVHEKYLGKDWKEWWSRVQPRIEKGWGEAYDLFLKEQYHIVVSYGTDPAYSMYFYNSTRYMAALAHVNGKAVAWLQIEGIGIVKNAPHIEEAKKFVEWFLSVEVEKEIPLNNWMYPANKNVELPDVYKYAIDPLHVDIANEKLDLAEISNNLDKWLDEWEEAVSG